MADLPQLDYGRRPRPTWKQWLRRLVWWGIWGIAGLAVTLVLAHTVWLIVSTWKLKQTISAVAASGAPSGYADLQPPTIPADQNGYVDLQPFLQSKFWTSPQGKAAAALKFTQAEKWADTDRATVRAYVEASAGVFQAIDRARQKTKLSTTRPYGFADLVATQASWEAEFVAARELYHIVHFASVLARQDGDDATFIRNVNRLAVFSKLGQHGFSGFLGCTLFSIGTAASNALLLDAAPTLRIGTGGAEVSPYVVRAMIKQMTDPQRDTENSGPFIEQIRAELVDQFWMMDAGEVSSRLGADGYTATFAAPSWPERYLARPLMRMQAAELFAQFNNVLAATSANDYRAALAALLPADRSSMILKSRSPGDWPLQPVFDGLRTSLNLSKRDFNQRTDRRLAAAMLASRLHEIDNGRLPTVWTDLVPAYLPEIPTDPMAAGRPPLGIRREGDTLIFWSVGENGKDDGGIEDPKVTWDRQWYHEGDRVVRLVAGGKPPATRPSTAPSDQ